MAESIKVVLQYILLLLLFKCFIFVVYGHTWSYTLLVLLDKTALHKSFTDFVHLILYISPFLASVKSSRTNGETPKTCYCWKITFHTRVHLTGGFKNLRALTVKIVKIAVKNRPVYQHESRYEHLADINLSQLFLYIMLTSVPGCWSMKQRHFLSASHLHLYSQKYYSGGGMFFK